METEHPPADTGPRVSRDDVKDIGHLRRTTSDRHIAGVAGGLARHLDVDPILVRVGLVVLVFFGGAGLLLYGAAWVLVPEEDSTDQPLGLDERSRVFALVAAGVLSLLAAVGDWAGAFWFPWPLAIVALLVLWFVNRKDSPAPAPYQGPVESYAGQSYAVQPYAGQPEGFVGTPDAVSYARPRPVNPRKRGPVLLWFTVALIALAEGVLGVVDVAGAAVPPSAYPALALAVTTAMLLLGAFWGRAGGLILLGLVAALATLVTTAGDRWDETVTHTPTSASQVPSTYELRTGEMVVDLSRIDDVDSLDDQALQVDGLVGRIEVIVPDDMDVTVDTNVVGGDSRVFDLREDGGDVTLSGFNDGGPNAPDLTINIDLVVGEILVRAS